MLGTDEWICRNTGVRKHNVNTRFDSFFLEVSGTLDPSAKHCSARAERKSATVPPVLSWSRDVPASNLVRKTGYLDWLFRDSFRPFRVRRRCLDQDFFYSHSSLFTFHNHPRISFEILNATIDTPSLNIPRRNLCDISHSSQCLFLCLYFTSLCRNGCNGACSMFVYSNFFQFSRLVCIRALSLTGVRSIETLTIKL